MRYRQRIPLIAALAAGACLSVAPTFAGPSRSASTYLYYGRNDARRGHWQAARGDYRWAVALEPRNVDAFDGLGNAYLHLGQSVRAHEAYGAALQISPHNSDAENGWHDSMDETAHEKWFADITAQAAQKPDDADLQTTYAEELLERGRTVEAQKAARNALRIDPKLSHATCVLGRVAFAEGHLDEARPYLETATHADRTDDDAWEALAKLETKENHPDAAIADFRNAVKAAPEHVEYYTELAAALDTAGKTDEATKVRAQAAQLKAQADAPAK